MVNINDLDNNYISANNKVEIEFLDYDEVVKYFDDHDSNGNLDPNGELGREKIKKRYCRLLEEMRSFIKGMGYDNYVVCNETILMHAVLGYYSDIKRLKSFHKINRANDTKILAYETSWLLRRKSLQVKEIKGIVSDLDYTYCNEQFALSQIIFWIKRNDNNKKSSNVFKQKELEIFSDIMFYHFKYRDCSPNTLELMLESFTAGRDYQRYLSMADD